MNSVNRGVVILAVIALIAATAIIYSKIVHRMAVPSVLRYVPADAEIVVATGDAQSLWTAIDRHFGGAIRQPTPDRPISGLTKAVNDDLASKGVPITSTRNLAEFGIDVHHGAILAAGPPYGSPGDGPVVVLLSISNPSDFEKFAIKLLGANRTERISGHPAVVKLIGDATYFLSYPEPGIAIVGNSWEFFRSALNGMHNRDPGLSGDDEFYHALTERRQWRLLTGSDVFFFWRPSNIGVVSLVSGVADIDDREVRLRVSLAIRPGFSRTMDDLSARSQADMSWQQKTAWNSVAAMAFEHPSAARYLPILIQALKINDLAPNFRPVFWELEQSEGFREIVIAIPRIEQGVPDILLGVWSTPERARALIPRLRQALEAKRDEMVLQGAVASYCTQNPSPGCNPTAAELMQAGLMATEPDSRLGQARLNHGSVLLPAASDTTKQKQEDPNAISYLAPPITANDLKYRKDLAGADPETLRSDRYRMATAVAGDVLWIATARSDLENLLSRKEVVNRLFSREADIYSPSLASNPLFQSVTSTWRANSRAWSYVNVDRLPALLQLTGDEDARKQLLGLFVDLRGHPALSIQVKPSNDGGRIRLTARLIRWTAVASP